MQNVSAGFLAAMHAPIIKPHLRGVVGGVPFADSDVLINSFRVCNQCVTANDINLGGVFVGELQLTLLSTIASTRGDWYGKTISVEYGLEFADGTIEWVKVPSGVFNISQATWCESGLQIVAYDNMIQLDKAYSNEQSTGTVYEWLKFIERKTGVAIGNTQEQIESMPNGEALVALYNVDNINTYRDVLSNLATVIGAFATINRNGQIELRTFTNAVVDTIDASKRFSGCTFADYTTRYTGISVTNIESNSTSYYHVTPDDGLTMNLGANPFLQFGIDETVDSMRREILNSLQSFEYVPFSATLLGCCVYDLGDLIQFDGGIANGSVGCIMSFDFSLSAYSIAGYGENPTLENVQSKQDKNIIGLRNAQVSETMSVTPLTNVSAVQIGSEWSQVGSVSFAVTKNQTIMFHAVSKMTLANGGAVRYKYELNGADLDFIHEVQTDVGVDTATLFIPFAVESNVPNTLKVYVISDDAVGVVDSLNLRGALLGSGIVIADWDGNIEIADIYESLILERDTSINFNDSGVVVTLDTPQTLSGLIDVFSIGFDSRFDIAFNDEPVTITMSANTYTRYYEGSTMPRIFESQDITRTTKGGYAETEV